MQLSAFLSAIHETGQMRFDSLEPPRLDPASEAEAINVLLAIDERRRLEMAREPPPLRSEPALWGARMLFRICQFLVFRQIPAERIESDLAEACPGGPGPARSYSVDLTFCRLPELLIRAANIASADPLVRQLQRLAWEWPLSSVGIRLEIEAEGLAPDLSALYMQPSLMQLYVDRILKTGDASRLHDTKVRAAVANAVGMHPELAGGLRFP